MAPLWARAINHTAACPFRFSVARGSNEIQCGTHIFRSFEAKIPVSRCIRAILSLIYATPIHINRPMASDSGAPSRNNPYPPSYS